MPGFDGTGPCGVGPMTGGGRGFCTVRPRVTVSDIDFLRNDLNSMRQQLAQIEDRIEKLGIKENRVNERGE